MSRAQTFKTPNKIGEERKSGPFQRSITKGSEKETARSKVTLAKKMSEKMQATPPMTTRTETNTQFFAPVIHEMGNSSLFDEEDEMNMSMDSGLVNRNHGLPTDPSPIANVDESHRRGSITAGLIQAVMEEDEEDERHNQ